MKGVFFMCMYLNSEVILTSILMYYSRASKGVSQGLIKEYCHNIKEQLSDDKVYGYDYVYFQDDQCDIESAVLKFPKQYKSFMDCYYRGDNFIERQFDNSFSKIDGFNNILKVAASNLICEEQNNENAR